MAALPTIAETIAIGEVSIYLSGNDNASGVLWGKRLNSPYSPVQIATCTDALLWQFEGDSTDETLRGVANYLIWMCGKYGLQSQYIITGSGGGSVNPAGSTRPQPLDFIVSGTSPIPTGTSSISIPQFAGWNVDFVRGGIEQNTTDVGDGSSYFGWNRTTAVFTCSPALQASELVRLTPS